VDALKKDQPVPHPAVPFVARPDGVQPLRIRSLGRRRRPPAAQYIATFPTIRARYEGHSGMGNGLIF